MEGGSHPASGLRKAIWSDADLEVMSWHDVTIHGMCVQPAVPGMPRLLFDLDYIVQWVHPVPPATTFSFWLAPATLVFEDVTDLIGDLDFSGWLPQLTVDGLRRVTTGDDSAEPLWHIEGHAFDLKFRAAGFRQFVRQPPRLVARRVLPHAERGGYSFAETSFA
ncbi:hypothetical protein ACWGIB_23565 [Streptomyces xiamenensis]